MELFYLKNFNFWIEMLIAVFLLCGISLYINHRIGPDINYRLFCWENKHLLIGIISAAVLYGIFIAGDRLSALIFDFANKQVTNVYLNKSLLDPAVIGLMLLFVFGPGEEIFWRGFVQDSLAHRFGDNAGWLMASLIYAGVHIFSMNLMLIAAALVCGLFWGYLFKRYESLWPGIISHAIWDLTIFVLLPVR